LVEPWAKAECLGGTTKAPPRVKRRAKAGAKAWGLVVHVELGRGPPALALHGHPVLDGPKVATLAT